MSVCNAMPACCWLLLIQIQTLMSKNCVKCLTFYINSLSMVLLIINIHYFLNLLIYVQTSVLFTLILSVSKGHTQAYNQEGKDWRKVDAAEKTNLNETLNKDKNKNSFILMWQTLLEGFKWRPLLLHAGAALLYQR